MATVKRCDRCGFVWDDATELACIEERKVDVLIAGLKDDKIVHYQALYDLCPKCVAALGCWLRRPTHDVIEAKSKE